MYGVTYMICSENRRLYDGWMKGNDDDDLCLEESGHTQKVVLEKVLTQGKIHERFCKKM